MIGWWKVRKHKLLKMSWVYHLNNWFYRNVIIWDEDYWVKSWLGKEREDCKLHCRSFGENSWYTDFELREGILLGLGRGGMDYSRNRGSRYLQQENFQGVMEAEIRLQEVGSEWTEATGKTTFWKKMYDWRNRNRAAAEGSMGHRESYLIFLIKELV